LKDSQSNKSGWLLESGPIVDQSFAGGSTTFITPKVFIGGGDYSTIYPSTNLEIVLTPNANGTYDIGSVGFGIMAFGNGVPVQGYFQQLGYTN
jgi:hypothetical protein